MEQIAKKTELDPKTAYTLGLLHNLGRIVLQKMALPLELPIGVADLPDPVAVSEWERENLGCTQAEAAAGVFGLWGLNSLFGEVITHYDERESTESSEVRRWAELLHLTVAVVETTAFKLGIKSDTVPLPETIFADVGLPPLDLEKLGDEITTATQIFCEQSGLHLNA
jgi:HD-like signal output (HDOD) protein